MFKRDERTKWHWEDPIPAMFDKSAEPLPDELARVVAIWRAAILIMVLAAIALVVIMKRGQPTGAWPTLPGLIGISVGIGSMLMNRYVADRRPPTQSLINVLNMIASVSPRHHREITKLHETEVLSFSIARRIAIENGHLIDEANRRNQEALSGPQMECETTGGDPIRFDTPNLEIAFTPCIDGWYRVHVTDGRLNLMLRNGAAGHDAGQYWIIDHRQGVWGIPAAFVPKVQERLEALSILLGGQKRPPRHGSDPEHEHVPK